MKRRIFLSAVFSILIAPQVGYAKERIFYSPGLAEAAIEEGKVVFLDFWTNWCTTCAAQDRVIRELRSNNQTYNSRITFITVNWDQYSDAQISKRLKVLRRSTLIAMKGSKELGRLVAATSRKDIKELMDKALLATGQ
jgi:thioredoxin 1